MDEADDGTPRARRGCSGEVAGVASESVVEAVEAMRRCDLGEAGGDEVRGWERIEEDVGDLCKGRG